MWSLGMVRSKSVEVFGELLCGFLDVTAPRFWDVRAGGLHELNGVPLIDEDFVELCENRSDLCDECRLGSRGHKSPRVVLRSCALEKLSVLLADDFR